MEDKVKQIILELGADVCGIANIDRFSNAPNGFHPKDIYSDCKSVISFGMALPKGILEVNPRIIYGHFNYVLLPPLDQIVLKAAKRLESEFSCMVVPIPSDSPYEYWDADNMEGRGLLSMKHIAVQAGLGTIGKSTLLINKEFGNRLVLGAVLTNLELQSDSLLPSLCLEGCNLCVESCPSHAIVDGSVNQKKCRQNTYGKTARGFDTVDCNKCRSVCPLRYGAR